MSDRQETIRVEGVSGELPKFLEGQLAIYFCEICGARPFVPEGQVAIVANHDACVRERGKSVLTFVDFAVQFSSAAVASQQAELHALRDAIHMRDPN